jgi:uncharacterized membrane protein (DUF373 family)
VSGHCLSLAADVSASGRPHSEPQFMIRQLPRTWAHLRRDWIALSAYQRFEASIASVLTVVIGAVSLVALYRLVVGVIETLVLRGLNPLDHSVFQRIFGEIMTLLIALEFNHSLHYRISPRHGIVHAKLVILIAALAIARKIIVADLLEMSAAMTAALGALMLSLGVVYQLMREPRGRPDTSRRSR